MGLGANETQSLTRRWFIANVTCKNLWTRDCILDWISLSVCVCARARIEFYEVEVGFIIYLCPIHTHQIAIVSIVLLGMVFGISDWEPILNLLLCDCDLQVYIYLLGGGAKLRLSSNWAWSQIRVRAWVSFIKSSLTWASRNSSWAD